MHKISKGQYYQRLLYCVLTGTLLLSYLLIQAYDSEQSNYSVFLIILRLVTAFLGIHIGKLWKDKTFLVLVAFFLYLIVRVIVKGLNYLFAESVSVSLFNAVWIISGCYTLGRILTIKHLKQFMRVFAAVWTMGTVIHCVLALVAAWTDHEILNLAGGSVWGIPYSQWEEYIPERLHVGYVHATVGGSTLSLSGVLAICALLAEPKRILKVFYAVAYTIICIALGLTDARTSFISLSAGVGIAVGSAVLGLIWNKKGERKTEQIRKRRLSILPWIVAIACMAVVFVVTMVGVMKMAPVFNDIKSKGSVLIPAAEAEDKAENTEHKRVVQSRGFSSGESLNGRQTIWRSVFRYMMKTPKRWLFGVSIHNPTEGLSLEFNLQVAHSHNMIMQVFLESGIPGLLFMLFMYLRAGICSFRLIGNKSTPSWLRLVPAIIVAVMVGDLTECFGWYRQWMIPAPAFLFVSFGIITAFGSKNRDIDQSSMMDIQRI